MSHRNSREEKVRRRNERTERKENFRRRYLADQQVKEADQEVTEVAAADDPEAA